MSARRQRWGWHQLDSKAASELVALAQVPPRAVVLDVGAGAGAITSALLGAGARVIAVELHPRRLRQLRERFGKRIVIVRADAADLKLPRSPFHLVANPPFSVTTPLVRRLLSPGSRLVAAHLVVQDQAARRWASMAAPGRRRWSRAFDVSAGRRIPRAAFEPTPRVDARLLVIERRLRAP